MTLSRYGRALDSTVDPRHDGTDHMEYLMLDNMNKTQFGLGVFSCPRCYQRLASGCT